jgi:hypothetical protein
LATLCIYIGFIYYEENDHIHDLDLLIILDKVIACLTSYKEENA